MTACGYCYRCGGFTQEARKVCIEAIIREGIKKGWDSGKRIVQNLPAIGD